jgi:hypothetical protein
LKLTGIFMLNDCAEVNKISLPMFPCKLNAEFIENGGLLCVWIGGRWWSFIDVQVFCSVLTTDDDVTLRKWTECLRRLFDESPCCPRTS